MQAKILNAGEGHLLRLGDVQMVVKEDGTHTRGTLALVEDILALRSQDTPSSLHIHHATEESFYILEGELELVVGTQTVRTGPGTFVMVPIGVAHGFRNPTEQPARFLVTLTPRRFLDCVEELSQLYQATAAPSRQQITELMARYDTEVVS